MSDYSERWVCMKCGPDQEEFTEYGADQWYRAVNKYGEYTEDNQTVYDTDHVGTSCAECGNSAHWKRLTSVDDMARSMEADS